ncbi:hypothetical protein PR048_008258 [Dryococelus australis]|uniref:DDE-1 domain-containing protein n=1 Tax=Dryococelus australis TaxID=614101 RepID=A0ABQ9HWL2_9NEOP|nr:hypothetical protein PR048_008258 [Dryococelus australis]
MNVFCWAVCSTTANITPQKNWQIELPDVAPAGTIGGSIESGCMTAAVFCKFSFQFIVRPSKEKPVLLILDGHFTHTRNIDAIDKARESAVSIVCLPPHSTDKLQPLDTSSMFPLKSYYAKAIENWLANNPNRVVRKLQVAKLFAEGYQRAAYLQTVKTGIFPFNPEFFTEDQFPSPNQVVVASISNLCRTAILVTGTPHKSKIQESQLKKLNANETSQEKEPNNSRKKLVLDLS